MAEKVRAAIAVYRGDLLEGWYNDWCLMERERLQSAYLALLDKLMGFSAARREYEAGLVYGQIILAHDRARERTHQRMMTLHSLAGDRTGALRQYRACVAALNEELGVAPSPRTSQLYERIAAGEVNTASEASASQASNTPADGSNHLPSARSGSPGNGNRNELALPRDHIPGPTEAHDSVDDQLKASFDDLVRLQLQVNRRVAELGHLLDLQASTTTPPEATD
jgi:DNA-binding SARP family transcriptional activator